MLTGKHLDALLWVRNCLDKDHPEVAPSWMEFDMYNWMYGPPVCGTHCCIGGSMDIYLAGYAKENPPEDVTRLVRREDTSFQTKDFFNSDLGLSRLFFSWGDVDPTPENAVKAIDAYLNGSQDPWSAA